MDCAAGRQSGSVRVAESAGATVCAAVSGSSAHGSVRAVRAALCGRALGSVWQCMRQCTSIQ
jgi:hypothetical protein